MENAFLPGNLHRGRRPHDSVLWFEQHMLGSQLISNVIHHPRAASFFGFFASQSLSTVFSRVCQPGPLALKADSTSGSRRMAICSLVGALFLPLTLRSSAIVAATPPPDVRTALLQSTPVGGPSGPAAAKAASIWACSLPFKVVFDFRSVGIAARDYLGPSPFGSGRPICSGALCWRTRSMTYSDLSPLSVML